MRKIFSNIIICVAAVAALSGTYSCNKFLDVVPDDGIATLDNAFHLRSTAIRYLGTCYSYMTVEGDSYYDPAMLGSDELWDLIGRGVTNTTARVPQTMFNIARGFQSATSVYGNDWASMYQGIRCCDILMDNVAQVPDMEELEKMQWISEAKFLKAYFHFNLIRKWGPVPVIRKSLEIDSDVEEVRVYRDNIDTCFNFVLRLLDEAEANLPLVYANEDEYGRTSKVACAALRARVAAYAASPLFNGNEEEASLVDGRGVRLFPAKTDAEKLQRWVDAMNACKHAIDLCDEANIKLFDKATVKQTYRMSDSLATTLAIRCAFNERWNQEIVWGNSQSQLANSTTTFTRQAMFQRLCMPILNGYTDMLGGYRFIGVPLKVVEQFYTNKGLPINNDLDWVGVNVMDLKDGDDSHSYYIHKGYTTAKLHFNREPRFYASIGFDGGTWLGQLGNYNGVKPDGMHYLQCRVGGPQGKGGNEVGPVTGYFPKKLFPFRATWSGNNSFSSYWYPFPEIRLSDLYLLYAECINEAEGPDGAHSQDLFKYFDAVRERAGIPDVKTSWDEYSNRPGYYSTKAGMRSIIHAERLNELAFESQRFYDLRRWKEAANEYLKHIYGCNVASASASTYYTKTLIAQESFGLKDYFWPIATSYIEVNPNLVQNIGW